MGAAARVLQGTAVLEPSFLRAPEPAPSQGSGTPSPARSARAVAISLASPASNVKAPFHVPTPPSLFMTQRREEGTVGDGPGLGGLGSFDGQMLLSP